MAGAAQQIAILKILVAGQRAVRDAFESADNDVDDGLLADLERFIDGRAANSRH